MTDFRALCAELLQPLAEFVNANPHHAHLDLVTRARLALTHPVEPQGPTDEEIERRFQRWWFDEGSGMRPLDSEDSEEHARRVSQIAWHNGAYVARWGRPAIEPQQEADRG